MTAGKHGGVRAAPSSLGVVFFEYAKGLFAKRYSSLDQILTSRKIFCSSGIWRVSTDSVSSF